MKTKTAALLLTATLGLASLCWAQNTPGQDASAPKSDTPEEVVEVLPLVQFEEAALVDVIKTLARQASLNVIFDPRVTQPGPEGKPLYPPVSIRLENVTAQNVLEAILGNNNLRLERDLKTKISRVTVRDPAQAEPLTTKIYQLKYTNPSNLVTILKPTMTPRSQVIPDGRTSQLIVQATEKEMIEVDNVINKLDLATKQVLIEAKILETTRNPSTIKGINWAGTFKAQNVAFGNNSFGELTISPGTGSTPGQMTQGGGPDSIHTTATPDGKPGLLGFFGDKSRYFSPVAYLNADGARAVFSFFNEDTETEVLATPRAVTSDNKPAMLSVSQAVPIFKVTQGGTQTGTAVDIVYTNLGTILEVTPRISANNTIALSVIPEVSSIAGSDSQVLDGETYTANIFSIRRVRTDVTVPSGNTLVLGGLLSDDVRKVRTKVPILGDLPGMKYVFGSKEKRRSKGNLLIFVTPTVVTDLDFQPSESNFLKTPPPPDSPMSDVGSFSQPWDGVEPYDWSKPIY